MTLRKPKLRRPDLRRPDLRRPESVLVVIYTPDEILLLKRNADFEFWQSVTGSLEAGETPDDAASRELFEETGIAEVELINCDHSAEFEISPRWRDRYPPGRDGESGTCIFVPVAGAHSSDAEPGGAHRFHLAGLFAGAAAGYIIYQSRRH